jgi:hypothetical protein
VTAAGDRGDRGDSLPRGFEIARLISKYFFLRIKPFVTEGPALSYL